MPNYKLTIVEEQNSSGYSNSSKEDVTVLCVPVPQAVLLGLVTLITTKLDETEKAAAKPPVLPSA